MCVSRVGQDSSQLTVNLFSVGGSCQMSARYLASLSSLASEKVDTEAINWKDLALVSSSLSVSKLGVTDRVKWRGQEMKYSVN